MPPLLLSGRARPRERSHLDCGGRPYRGVCIAGPSPGAPPLPWRPPFHTQCNKIWESEDGPRHGGTHGASWFPLGGPGELAGSEPGERPRPNRGRPTRFRSPWSLPPPKGT
eukprot:6626961-Pyramimonas_sp.AAC.1